MKLNKDLAAIHAYLCADGYVIKNPETQKHKYYMIGFRNINLTLLKDFQNRFEKFFGVKPRLIKGQRCKIGSKEIYEKLSKFFGSFYSYEWTMPLLNLDLSKIWLRAFFDCEGWVYCKSHQNRVIGLESVNKEGLQQVKDALEILGISCKISKRLNRSTSALNIFGKENIIKFEKTIGFLHPDKKNKLKETISDFMNYNWIFPIKETQLKRFVKDIISEKAKIKKGSWTARLISNKETNLIRLQKELNNLFGIESKINKRVNGIGTTYFELNINKQDDIKKLIDFNLLNEEQKQKWKLKK